MDETNKYRLIIAWSEEDRQFVVTVPELSDCRTSGDTYEDAVAMAQEAIGSWLDVARASGRPIPEPQMFNHDADTGAAWADCVLVPDQRAEAVHRLRAKAAQSSEPTAV